MPLTQTRRRFLTTLASVGTAGLVRVPRVLAAEGPLETTAIRLEKLPNTCYAPQYVAEELLRAEGFTDIRFVDTSTPEVAVAVGRGSVDLSMAYGTLLITAIASGEPITVLGGVMVGCIELIANESMRTVADLKGKSVGVQALGSFPHILLILMAAHVGLDPVTDIHWVTSPKVKPKELFVDGKIDAFLGFAPEPQELRARHIGHVVLSTAVDRPWSQYFCCMLAGNQEFVQQHPVATQRAMRAILKTTDLCAAEPARIARRMVDAGFTDQYDYALQTLTENPYDRWRDYDPEDTMQFYALRLHEAGLIKTNPNKIIAEHTDWRFFNELKRELKA